MLYHHGPLPYQVQLADCAEKTRASFERILTNGVAQLPATLEYLEQVPDDTIVKASYLDFIALNSQKYLATTTEPNLEWNLHDNAWNQICQKLDFPRSYGEDLIGTDWGCALLEKNINDLMLHQNNKRFLLRSIKGEVRGFLSDKFRRLDGRPILQTLFTVAQELGAVVISTTHSDVRTEVKFAFPVILEPVKNEPIMVFVAIRWSDYGTSRVQISVGLVRAWCTNYATVESVFSQVHLGRALPDDIEFSAETYEKDTLAVVAATKDVFRDAFSEKRIGSLCEVMASAAETEGPRDIKAALKRAGLSKGEQEAVNVLYDVPDIEILPRENTMWKFSNAISFLAKKAQKDRALELEGIAGNILNGPRKQPLMLQAAVA